MKANGTARVTGCASRICASARTSAYLVCGVLSLLALFFTSRAESKTTIPILPDDGGATNFDPVIVTADRLPNSFGGIAGMDLVGGVGWGRNWRDELFEPNITPAETPDEPNPGTTCPASGNPVVLANGNKIETAVDFESQGDMPLTLTRVWKRYGGFKAGLFFGWRTPFESSLSFPGCAPGSAECERIWLTRFDGVKLEYRKGSDGFYYEVKASPISKIELDTDGMWILYGEDRKISRYDQNGKILEIKNEQGIGWLFTYREENADLLHRVTHTNGRYIEFTWANHKDPVTGEDRGPRVTRVRTPTGHYVDYKYTADIYGRLRSVTLPGSPPVTITYHYSYDSGEAKYSYTGALTGRSINGIRYSTFTYDHKSRATRTEHAGGVERYTFSYVEGDSGELTTTETNPLGKQAVYSFKEEKLQSITGKPSAHCDTSFSDVKYDKNGYKDNAADFEGNLTDYTYDDHGHLLKKTEAYGESGVARTTEYGWDETKNRLTSVRVAGLSETNYIYRVDGRVERISIKNLSGNGVANQVRTTTYSYTLHPNGIVATMKVDGPIAGTGDAYTITYASTGDVLTLKNSLGHTTTYSGYNAYGLPGTIVGPNGERADFVYDGIGRLLEMHTHRNGTLQKALYSYDAFGRLAAVTRPGDVKHVFQYDVAGRLIAEYRSEEGGLYSQKAYRYNAMSLPILEETRRVSFEPAQGTVQ